MAARVAETGRNGVYRPSRSGPYRVRLQVPADVRAIVGRREWDVSLQTDSATEADRLATDLRARWKGEIAAARSRPADLDQARDAIMGVVHKGMWRSVGYADIEDGWPARWRQLLAAPPGSTVVAPPLALVMASLRHALQADDYAAVPGLDATTADLLSRARYPATPELIIALRPYVARLWSTVFEAHEKGRQKRELETALAAISGPSRVLLPDNVTGRRTVGALIAAYRAERESKHGKESTDRKYSHLFRALKEALDEGMLVTDLTRADCRKVRDFLRKVPSNAAKKFKTETLAEAIKFADDRKEPTPRLAPNTVNSYLSNLIAMLTFAVKEDWIATNPASGLVEKGRATTKRRGFTEEELYAIHEPLTGWRRWYFAILLYSGARAGEVAQLRRGDVRQDAHGRTWLSLEEFDKDGVRDLSKSLKTRTSERIIPIHADLVALGLPAFLTASDDPKAQVFPEVRETVDGWTHELSKWFAAHLRRVKVKVPAVVMHSYRHNFRDAGRRVGLSDNMIDALGGWAAASVGERYGNRAMVDVLQANLDRVNFGDFWLT